MRYSNEKSLIRLLGMENSKVRSFWDEQGERMPKRERTLHPEEYHITLEEAAFSLNVSTERVRQIEVNAINKLRHPKRASLLRDFLYE